MNRLITITILCLVFQLPYAQEQEPKPVPIWQKDQLPADASTATETVVNREDQKRNEFGLNRAFSNVTLPGYYYYAPPKNTATKTVMVVCPGGGYRHLAIDKEGHDVARWLTTLGIHAFVLKYRTGRENIPLALEDALRMVRMLRSENQWEIDPQKIGMIGFSAGGHLIASVAAHANEGDPDNNDRVERFSSAPNFLCLIYTSYPKDVFEKINSSYPPTFIAHAHDDRLSAADGARYYIELHEAGVESELHIYSKGGHGFGLGVNGGAVSSWPARLSEWMSEMQLIP